MAEVSHLHLHEDDDLRGNVVAALDSFPYCSHGFDSFDVFPSDPDFPPSDLSLNPHITSVRGINELSGPDSITPVDHFDRENRVNFLMDLIHPRVEQLSIGRDLGLSYPDPNSDPRFGFIEGNDVMGSTHLGIDMDLGLGFGNDDIENCDRCFTVSGFDDDLCVSRSGSLYEFDVSSTLCSGGEQFVGGSRGIRVSSDWEDGEDDVLGINLSREDDWGLDDNVCDEDTSLGLCGDSFQLEENRDGVEDFEWEEVDGRVDEREVLSMFFDDDVDEDLDASVSTLIPSREEVGAERRNLEWEVLINVHNAETNVDIGNAGNGYNYTPEYEMLIAQFAEEETGLVGRPPASKKVVDDLPLAAVDDNNGLCAICKDEIKIGEQAKQLPCSHQYHVDCILPWLGIRNTCPVCRYELPTDDPAYERMRTQRAAPIL